MAESTTTIASVVARGSNEEAIVASIRQHVHRMLKDRAVRKVVFTFETNNGGVRRGNIEVEYTARFTFADGAGAY